MGIGQAVRERATKVTCLLVDDRPIDPWLVGIDFAAQGSLLRPLEFHLGLPILIFELQQCEVNVNHDTILAFILEDVKNHRDAAIDVYLTIVRHVVNPPPRRKNLGWFARMFTRPPKWTPPVPKWKWTSIGEISVSNEDALVIRGSCCPVATA